MIQTERKDAADEERRINSHALTLSTEIASLQREIELISGCILLNLAKERERESKLVCLRVSA